MTHVQWQAIDDPPPSTTHEPILPPAAFLDQAQIDSAVKANKKRKRLSTVATPTATRTASPTASAASGSAVDAPAAGRAGSESEAPQPDARPRREAPLIPNRTAESTVPLASILGREKTEQISCTWCFGCLRPMRTGDAANQRWHEHCIGVVI